MTHYASPLVSPLGVSESFSVEGESSSAQPADPDQAAVQRALAKMLEYPYPPSAFLWASVWMPRDYENVVKHYPDQIQQLWTARAQAHRFQAVLDNLVNSHRWICQAFTRYKAENPTPEKQHHRHPHQLHPRRHPAEDASATVVPSGTGSVAGWRAPRETTRNHLQQPCPSARLRSGGHEFSCAFIPSKFCAHTPRTKTARQSASDDNFRLADDTSRMWRA